MISTGGELITASPHVTISFIRVMKILLSCFVLVAFYVIDGVNVSMPAFFTSIFIVSEQ